MPPRVKGAPDLLDDDISFPLARLFDRFNLDHIPPNKRMDEFEHRDLAHIKHYKAAVKIFGGPLSRKRVMVAPPMELPIKHRLGLYANQKPMPAPPKLNSELQPQAPAVKPEPEELVLAREAREREDKYKAWFKERQKFRNDLENMGLNLNWLSTKPNKTLLEKRVLQQLKVAEGKADEIQEVISETPETVIASRGGTPSSESSILPHLKVPAPLGLQILDQHLKEQKLRLLDLFTDADKNKDWNISREEFIKQCQERNIPLSKPLLEDMLMALDMNLDEELNYKELARGLALARREKRDDKRKELSRESTSLSQQSGSLNGKRSQNGSANNVKTEMVINQSQFSSTSKNTTSPKLSDKPKDPNQSKDSENTKDSKMKESNMTGSSPKSKRTADKGDFSDKSTNKSLGSKGSDPKNQSVLSSVSKGTKTESDKGTGPRSERTGTPTYLEPPLIDTQPDRLILGTEEEMVDLRKLYREALKGYNAKIGGIPPTILTGTKAIDDHCMQSTLEGEVGDMVNKFRLDRLQEFFEITKLCQQNNIVLSKNLLERVLLYPPDKPHAAMQKLRHPDSAPLVSSHFADPPKRPRTPIEVKHKDKVRRSKSGKLLIDSRHKYPSSKSVSAEAYKQNLSTGRAVIRRRVDCWMTFEEYEKLTKHLAVRYQHLHGSSKTNAFWPGHLIDKIRLCMPPYDKASVRDKELAIYQRLHRKPAANYGYEPMDVWQTNDSMYTQIGIHDHFKNKTII